MIATLSATVEAPAAAVEDLLTSYVSGTGAFGPASGFNIEVVFEGTWTAALQEAFIIASEYLSFLIRGDLTDKGGIDDIRITAELSDIDGSGGMMGGMGGMMGGMGGGGGEADMEAIEEELADADVDLDDVTEELDEADASE